MTSAALTARPRRQPAGTTSDLGSPGARRPQRLSGGGGLTLEQRLGGVWEGLRAVGAAACPVCQGPIVRGGHGASSARCDGCGSMLA